VEESAAAMGNPAAIIGGIRDTMNIPGMDPHSWWVLSLMLRGYPLTKIAKITGINHPRLLTLTQEAVFREQLDVQSRIMVENITNGNYGVTQIARANAPNAMRRIIEHSRQDDDRKTSLLASKEILNYAGLQPVRRIETLSVNDLFHKMTPEELIHYAKTVELPDRFEEQARQFQRPRTPGDAVLTLAEERRFAQAKRMDPDDPIEELVGVGPGE
jgi:hypothetical protein